MECRKVLSNKNDQSLMLRFFILFILFYSCSSSPTDDASSSKHKNQFLQTEKTQLSNPQLLIDSLFFLSFAKVELSFQVDDADILYSLNDEKFQLYDSPLKLDKTTTLKTFASQKGYINSDTSSYQLIRSSGLAQQASIKVSPSPSEKYSANRSSSLVDLKKGDLDFKKDKDWLGFQSKELMVYLNFDNNKMINAVHISLLSDPGAWIFLPAAIKIYLDNILVASKNLEKTNVADSPTLRTISFNLENVQKCRNLSVGIEAINEIPEWHQGKGNLPWLFIDEIILE